MKRLPPQGGLVRTIFWAQRIYGLEFDIYTQLYITLCDLQTVANT